MLSVKGQFINDLCEFYLRIEDYNSARQMAVLILKDDSVNATALLVMGFVNEIDGNLPMAISYYEKIIANNPKDTNAIKRKALVEMTLHMDKQALTDINLAIELDRSDPESLVIRGMISIYAFHKKIDAIVDYNKALQMSPLYALALYHRGYAYLKYGNVEYARDDFAKAEELGNKEAVGMLERYFPNNEFHQQTE